MNIKMGGGLLGIAAIVLLVATTGAVYACPEPVYPPHCSPNCIDLKIRDQDEGWRDGVSGTWTAANMAPGDTYDFQSSFVGLKTNNKGRLAITCGYTVTEEWPPVESDTDPYTYMVPDKMAKELILTKCLYQYGGWQIDLLTGLPSGMPAKDKYSFYNYYGLRWKIADADHDGRITFCDLKAMPLSGLPLPSSSMQGAWFVMSVKFAESAGNELQGDRFNLTMSYMLRPW